MAPVMVWGAFLFMPHFLVCLSAEMRTQAVHARSLLEPVRRGNAWAGVWHSRPPPFCIEHMFVLHQTQDTFGELLLCWLSMLLNELGALQSLVCMFTCPL
jgi:hypothetical protein